MPMNYENGRPTRIYRPEAKHMSSDNQRIGFTQPLEKPKGLFDGISIAQVAAGAAAAATSMLLASKIGIAGSVIGAAVSSAVTIVCSQLYRRALDASAKKLRDSRLLGSVDASLEPAADEGGKTDRPWVSGFDTSAPAGRVARVAPVDLQNRAAADRSATQRKVVIAALVTAVAAVALSAGAILAGTAGQGLGERPEPILAIPAAGDGATGAGQGKATDDGTATDASKDGKAQDGATPSGGADDGGDGSGTATGTDSDNGATGDDGMGGDDSQPSDADGNGNAHEGSTEGAPGEGDVSSGTGPDSGQQSSSPAAR